MIMFFANTYLPEVNQIWRKLHYKCVYDLQICIPSIIEYDICRNLCTVSLYKLGKNIMLCVFVVSIKCMIKIVFKFGWQWFKPIYHVHNSTTESGVLQIVEGGHNRVIYLVPNYYYIFLVRYTAYVSWKIEKVLLFRNNY